jgi:hypothetical protein
MTILPDDRYLSVWQRAKARLRTLIEDFKYFYGGDIVRLPDGWKPKQAERSVRGSDG